MSHSRILRLFFVLVISLSCLTEFNQTFAQDANLIAQINAGGEAIDITWGGDTETSPSFYLLDGSANIESIRNTPTVDASVPEGTPLTLFETMRIDADQPEPFMEWSFTSFIFPMYEVNLYFIEMSRCSVGNRVFDIEINGVIVEEDFDVYAEAGNQCDVGIMRSYQVIAYDNEVHLRFPLVNGKPSTLAAIQVWGIHAESPIEDYAGTGFPGYNGEDLPALSANIDPQTVISNEAGDVIFTDDYERIRIVDAETNLVSTLVNPSEVVGETIVMNGVALDSNENLYFSVVHNVSNAPTAEFHQIRRLDAVTGEITIIAGANSDEPGYAGDGGPALDAKLRTPWALIFDTTDNLYFSDSDNNVIRRIDAATGIIETVAGTGVAGFSGDGGQATAAQLDSPSFLTIDEAGDLYFSDSGNHRIRKVVLPTGVISTIAGTDSEHDPFGFPAGGGYSGDGGPATEAELSRPLGITFDTEGNVLIADWWNSRIRKVDVNTGIITSLIQYPEISGPWGIARYQNELFIGRSDYLISRYTLGDTAPGSMLSVSPASVDFGYTPLGQVSDPVVITVTNEGTTEIIIENIETNYTAPHQFLHTDILAPIPGGASAQFEVSFSPGNSLSPVTFSSTSLHRINAGGTLLTDTAGDWSEDSDLNPSAFLDAGTANIETTNTTATLDASVPTGTPLSLFSAKRIDANKADPVMSWNFPATTGEQYEVRLFFVEMSRCATGSRVFDVEIEGELVQDALDVYDEAGGCNIGIMKTFTVSAADDNLDVDFPLQNGKPSILAGIEVLSLGGPTTEEVLSQASISHNGMNGTLLVDLAGTTDVAGTTNLSPIASFDTSVSGLSVDFTDTSIDNDGTITSWSWDLGDGNNSTEENPSHTYFAAGSYNVTLEVTDDDGAVGSTTISIEVTDPMPEDITVSLATLQVDAGNSGLIPITVNDITGEGFISYDFTITYDESVIEIVGVDTTGTLSIQTNAVANTTVPGEISVGWGNVFPLTGAGVLLNLNVNYLTAGISPLTFFAFEFNEGGTAVIKVDGNIEVVNSGGTGAFIETDGLVVMEAENAQVNIAKNNQAWEEATENAGFSGTSYMASTPDIGEVYNTTELDLSPELQFEVSFSTAGSYNFWVNLASHSTKSNVVHVGFDGEMHEINSTIGVAYNGAWSWRSAWHHGSKLAFEVTEPGTHTINVWVREDGVLFDKILLINDPSYTPSGVGPDESPQASSNVVGQTGPGILDQLVLSAVTEELPEEFALKGNYPNPFNPTTTIQFEIPEASTVSLEVFDLMGRRIATLANGNYNAGHYEVQWNATTDAGSRVASGIYLFQMRAGNFEAVHRMVLMK